MHACAGVRKRWTCAVVVRVLFTPLRRSLQDRHLWWPISLCFKKMRLNIHLSWLQDDQVFHLLSPLHHCQVSSRQELLPAGLRGSCCCKTRKFGGICGFSVSFLDGYKEFRMMRISALWSNSTRISFHNIFVPVSVSCVCDNWNPMHSMLSLCLRHIQLRVGILCIGRHCSTYRESTCTSRIVKALFGLASFHLLGCDAPLSTSSRTLDEKESVSNSSNFCLILRWSCSTINSFEVW